MIKIRFIRLASAVNKVLTCRPYAQDSIPGKKQGIFLKSQRNRTLNKFLKEFFDTFLY